MNIAIIAVLLGRVFGESGTPNDIQQHPNRVLRIALLQIIKIYLAPITARCEINFHDLHLS